MRTAAATSRCSPALRLRGGHATISRRSDLDGYGPFEPKGPMPEACSQKIALSIARPDWLKSNPDAPAVNREAEEVWGK